LRQTTGCRPGPEADARQGSRNTRPAVPTSPSSVPPCNVTHAATEIDAFFRKTGKIIIALTVKDILEEQLARKLA